jgi:hypothetical protein
MLMVEENWFRGLAFQSTLESPTHWLPSRACGPTIPWKNPTALLYPGAVPLDVKKLDEYGITTAGKVRFCWS